MGNKVSILVSYCMHKKSKKNKIKIKRRAAEEATKQNKNQKDEPLEEAKKTKQKIVL